MAVSETTGPSPACSVCTWVSVTLNGVPTFTSGAVVSVEPVTATLPVAPFSVHSGVPPVAGAAVGQVLAAAGVGGAAGICVSVTENGSAAAVLVEDVLADEVSVSEPHAASVVTSAAAMPASATVEDRRGEFTVATLQPHCAVTAGRWLSCSFQQNWYSTPSNRRPTWPRIGRRAPGWRRESFPCHPPA